MKEGRPSLTALYVAFARALATYDPELARACRDPWAAQLLPTPLRQLCEQVQDSPRQVRLLRASLTGFAEHIAMRTRLIDDAVESAIARGARQLVIVGAGIDARAHRLDALSACTVFELDFPSTQQFKQKRARNLPRSARALHYVPCDFESTPFDRALEGAGFDARTPSMWIWEGVTMYLTPALVSASLAMMARLSAPHSRLVLTYLAPAPHINPLLFMLALSMLGAVSEPIRASFESTALAELLRDHAWSLLSDVSPRDAAARRSIRFPAFDFGAPSERLAVAEKL